MKILIIEDENPAADRLKQLLLNVDSGFDIFGPLDTVSGAVKHLKTNSAYDVIFLDIQLADGKSFHIFDQITLHIPVIFVTAYDDFAIKAFELNSVDYLLKPISAEKLDNSLKKLSSIRRYYEGRPEPDFSWNQLVTMLKNPGKPAWKTRFLVNRADELIPIPTEGIAWFNATEKTVILMTLLNERYFVNYSLDDLENKLNPSMFFRINRQFICSLKAVAKVHNFFNYKLKLDLTPQPSIEVIVSKNRTAEFKAWLNDEVE